VNLRKGVVSIIQSLVTTVMLALLKNAILLRDALFLLSVVAIRMNVLKILAILRLDVLILVPSTPQRRESQAGKYHQFLWTASQPIQLCD
jgi:hypothetical protein